MMDKTNYKICIDEEDAFYSILFEYSLLNPPHSSTSDFSLSLSQAPLVPAPSSPSTCYSSQAGNHSHYSSANETSL